MLSILKCRLCGSKKLIPLLSLGNQYISNFVKKCGERGKKIPLVLLLCGDCKLVQLKYTTPPELLYTKYWYKSGISSTIRDDLKDIVDSIKKLVVLEKNDKVVDIGCNDGTMLRYYSNDLVKIGFEPSDLYKEAEEGNDWIVHDYFSLHPKGLGYENLFDVRAKVVTAISMFYDLDDPNQFLEDVKSILHEDGIFVIQQNYLVSMMEQNAFDNIVHEHLEYYSLYSLEKLLGRHGMEVFHVETSNINGGSFRTYIRLKKGNKCFSSSLKLMRRKEKLLKLDRKGIYLGFSERVKKLRKNLKLLLFKLKKEKKSIGIYGASTRGNTTLQYCGIDKSIIDFATDKNLDKLGRHTITMIPIISIEEYRKRKPDVLLVMTWHFFDEIRKQEKDYDGMFVVPMPSVKSCR